MSTTEEPQQPIAAKRAIYLLPNLFTSAGLFAGFYSIVAALKGMYDYAAIAIFVALIFDGIDGPVARLTQTESAFGAEYDSLADMVSFGVAPSLLAYSFRLNMMGKVGWLVAFLFTAATALRLARFNVHVNNTDKQYFQGMPCPAAAGLIASIIWLTQDTRWLQQLQPLWLWLLMLCTACLMVSNIRYYSVKKFDLKGKISFVVLLAILLIIACISWDPPLVIFWFLLLYMISGLANTLYRWYRAKTRHHGHHK